MPPRHLRIGTRGSPMALRQTALVRDRLVAAHPELAANGAVEDCDDPHDRRSGAGPAARRDRRLSVASRLHRASVTAATPVKPGAPKPTSNAPPRACPSATSQRGDSGTQARISKVSRAGTKPQAKSPGLSITCERRDTPKQPAENKQANAGGRLVYWSRMAGLSTIR